MSISLTHSPTAGPRDRERQKLDSEVILDELSEAPIDIGTWK
jgi:hypothetical protein